MGERTKYTHGTFCWTDLATTDQSAAKDFYAGLLGWSYDDMPMDDRGGVYSMAQIDGGNVAAIAPIQQPDHPPYWASYVNVDSADDAAARAQELGGNVMMGPFDVFESGRMAVIQDPQGAAFGVWQANQHIGAQRVNEPGALVWNQVSTTDVEGAKKFYGDLFGWTFEPFQEGSETEIFRNAGSDKTGGGIGPLPQPGVPPNWGVSFGVEDLDAAAGKATETGGPMMVPPSDMGGIGRFLVAADPQGAVFALYVGQMDP
jgi:predicted enzyme related to lactoylglutathione lyase